MALNWAQASIPANKSFDDVLYDLLVPLEANTPTKRQTVTLVGNPPGNPTIGIGFDLITGGIPVQNAVLKKLGFDPIVVDQPNTILPGTLQAIELAYVQQLRNDINAHAGQAALTATMAARLANSNPAYNIV